MCGAQRRGGGERERRCRGQRRQTTRRENGSRERRHPIAAEPAERLNGCGFDHSAWSLLFSIGTSTQSSRVQLGAYHSDIL